MAVNYEVRITVEHGLNKELERYMNEQHLADVLATGYFAGATFVREEDNRYLVVYEADTREDLDEYLEKESPRLREDFAVHFPEGVTVERKITETE